MVDIFQFNDYRRFLISYSEMKKRQKPSWTYGAWARTLGLAGTSSLTMILNGQRHPGSKMIERFKEYFAFDQEREEFFSGLVELSKTRQNPAHCALIAQRLHQLSARDDIFFLQEDQFAAVSDWYNYALRELASLPTVKLDPLELTKVLVGFVAPSQIRRAINRLKRMGLIKSDQPRTLALPVSLPDQVYSQAARVFHGQTLELAQRALKEEPTKNRIFKGQTVTVKASELPKVSKLLDQLQDQLARSCETKDGDEDVYHLAIQFFPMTKRRSENEV